MSGQLQVHVSLRNSSYDGFADLWHRLFWQGCSNHHEVQLINRNGVGVHQSLKAWKLASNFHKWRQEEENLRQDLALALFSSALFLNALMSTELRFFIFLCSRHPKTCSKPLSIHPIYGSDAGGYSEAAFGYFETF
ncbi:unnamed protein product [Lathyrus sativus]|nr:unnamed protein product [Lathyrus sativus]